MKSLLQSAVLRSVFIGVCLILFISFISCRKDTNQSLSPEYGTITDIDGNIYKTVKIGGQWWMAENLKVTRYQNGDSIDYVEIRLQRDSTKWSSIQSGAYSIIDNLDSTSQNYQGKMFGYLYNGFTIADTRNIAPAGWHIPRDSEWKQLEEYLGMSYAEVDKVNWRGNDEGNKLKTYKGWNISSDKYKIWGSNESGFTATGGGCCMYTGIWGSPGTFSTGFWWSSSLEGNNEAWYRYLDYNKANVFRFHGLLSYGFSIRCVKD
jgi:uncharacterized protein (TIGR02145 family)